MKMKKIDVLLFQILFVALGGAIMARVAGLNGLSSLFFTVTFPVTGLLWLCGLRNGFDKTDWIMLAAAAVALINVLINVRIYNAAVGLSYFKKWVMFTMTLMLLQASNKMRAGHRLREFLHCMVDVVAIYLLFAHMLFQGQMHTLNNQHTKYAAFNFSNPNLTAIFFTCIYMLEVIRAVTVRDLWDKVIHGELAVMMGIFVIDTTSRNGLLVMLLFTALAGCVLLRGWIRDTFHITVPNRISRPVAGVISVIPAAFALVYMALINASWVEKLFGFLVSEGKKLNSRVKEWAPALKVIREYPLFGDYFKVTGESGSGQTHNTHMDIAASYGVPVLILVCVLLAVYIYQKGKRYRKQSDQLYMLGFICTVLLGIFESVMFSGGLGVYIFMCAFLLLSRTAGEGRTDDQYDDKKTLTE